MFAILRYQWLTHICMTFRQIIFGQALQFLLNHYSLSFFTQTGGTMSLKFGKAPPAHRWKGTEIRVSGYTSGNYQNIFQGTDLFELS